MYRIVRFYKDHPEGKLREIVRTGLTLEEAQAHCNDPETSSSTATNDIARAGTKKYGAWFDGYEEVNDDPDDDWANREGMPEFNGSFR